MRKVFESSEAVLQVDTTNAFNCLNCQAALRNILVLCPTFARILINTYREDSKLYINLLSQEGTTQGDPLAMPMDALGVVPLIQILMSLRCGMRMMPMREAPCRASALGGITYGVWDLILDIFQMQ